MSEKLEKAVKVSVLSVMVFLIAIAGFSYAYFNPTVQGNEQASSMYVTTKKIVHPLYTVLESLAEAGTYASTYSGTSNDTYGKQGSSPIYYIRTSTANDTTQADELINNKINVKFAGFCWQMYRTTDTGGVKLIYNGEPDSNGHCLRQDTETTHKGIRAGGAGTYGAMTGDYMYSDKFTYDTSTNQFTLVNPVVKNWSNSSDKEYILGKYTCKTNNTTSTCSTLYFVNISHRTIASCVHYTTYTIGDTQHAQIGTSPFNANQYSLAYVGYKFGIAYENVSSSAPSSTDVIMGKDVYWNGSNYVLKDGDNDSTYTYTGTLDSNYHYTCNTTSATCTDGKVRYYYYANNYIELTGGDKVEDAISKMLTNSSNTHNSAMKVYLENWYYNNIYGTSAESYIEQDAVYCNDRSIKQLAGWSKTGSLANNSSNYLQFKNYNAITDFGCTNNADKFSVSNPNAELTYPIGLADSPEMNLINNSNVRKTGQVYWLLSPYYLQASSSNISFAYGSGGVSSGTTVTFQRGVRPVITLKAKNVTLTGTGSLSSPYEMGS